MKPPMHHTVVSRQSGFTILEAVIAAAVFAIVMIVVVDLFLLFLKSPQDEVAQQELHEQMSFFSNFMALEMRHAVLDYDAYDGSAPCGTLPAVGTPTNVLCIIGEVPTQVYIDTHPETGNPEMAYYSAGGTPVQLVSDQIAIDTLEFFMYPNGNSFDPSTGLHTQPSILIVIEGRSLENETVDPVQYQTLIVLREYGR